MFRIYYADGTTYQGPPDQAPGWGIVVIAQYGDGWWGHDMTGLMDCLAQPGPNIVLHGRTVSKPDWRAFLTAAHQDPDFPQTEDRSLMHGWDHYCHHGSDGPTRG